MLFFQKVYENWKANLVSMKKSYFLIVTITLLSIVLISGCLTSKHYEENGISFNYPSNWKTGVINDLPGALVGISESSQVDVKIFRYNKTNDTSLREVYINSLTNKSITLDEYCYKQISNTTLTVDGVLAYELIYQIGCNDTQTRQKIREVWFEKNGYIYRITCTVIPPEDFPTKNRSFNEIINSFHVN